MSNKVRAMSETEFEKLLRDFLHSLTDDQRTELFVGFDISKFESLDIDRSPGWKRKEAELFKKIYGAEEAATLDFIDKSYL